MLAFENAQAGNDYKQRDLATLAQVSESQVSRWHQEARFLDELARMFASTRTIQRDETIGKLWKLAGKGNVMVFNALCDRLERWGLIPTVAVAVAAGAEAQASAGAVAVAGTHIHIHGIPEPASRSTLPPPLELPAGSTVSPQPK